MPSFSEAELSQAAQKYRKHSKEKVSLIEVTPQHPNMDSLYQQFLQIPLRIDHGANDGDWIAFQLGIKPVIREFISTPHLQRLQQRCEHHGWALKTLEAPMSENRLTGQFMKKKKPPAEQSRNFLVYIGKDRKRLRAIRDIDIDLLASGYLRKWFKSSQAHRQTGALLGYPSCCIEAFCACLEDNRKLLQRSHKRTSSFHPLLNTLSLSMFHYVCWTPCRFDCEASLSFAKQVDHHLQNTADPSHRAIQRYLGMPRLYIDDRRQILFDGSLQSDGSIRYSAAYVPFQFEQKQHTMAFDWIFYAQCVSRLLKGDQIRLSGASITVLLKGTQIDKLRLTPRPILFPFAAS